MSNINELEVKDLGLGLAFIMIILTKITLTEFKYLNVNNFIIERLWSKINNL